MAFLMVLIVAGIVGLQPDDWPQFRGLRSAGIAANSTPPLDWSIESGENVAWSVELPGRGISGPIVVGKRVIVTSSSGDEQNQLHVYAMDDDSGAVLWQRTFWGTGRTACHPLSAMSAPTPASDGERIVAQFASNDVICLDIEGNIRWLRCLGVENPLAFDDRGLASSPLIIGDLAIVQIATQGSSFVTALDMSTGNSEWTYELSKKTNWASPISLAIEGQDWIVVQSADALLILDPATGRPNWSYEVDGSLIPTPVADGPVVFLPADGLTCLRLPRDSSDIHVEWTSNALGPQSASPLLANGHLFVMRPPNMLTCGDAKTGKVLWKARIEGQQFWATPAIAENRMYIASADGIVQIVDLDDEGKILGKATMSEEILGSPAIARDALYLRGVKHLWKIAETGA